MSGPRKYKVIFQPSGKRGEVDEGVSVIQASRQFGVDIETLCGEKGACGKCRVRIEKGFFEDLGIQSGPDHASPWQEEEDRFIGSAQREEGYRLGCCARVQGDLLVFVPEESRAGRQVVSKAPRDIPIEWNPAVRQYHLVVSKPSFEDPTADLERVLLVLEQRYGLKNLSVDYPAMKSLPDCLRKGHWEVTVAVWMGKEIVRVAPGSGNDLYGIAVDVGTTTVAAYLCNLRTTEVVETVSMMNPQCKYGEDVMSRISYAVTHEDGLERMSREIRDGLNQLIAQVCRTSPPFPRELPLPTRDEIVDMTIVGNTAMHHILLRLNPENVALAPFPPVLHKGLDIKARDLDIRINESAYVHFLPNEAGFVGADNVGVLISENLHKEDCFQLIVDIGTNGELVLGNRRRFLSASCATGPAFEGAHLTFGMRAAPGAIEKIRIDPETHEVDYKVIGREIWKNHSKPEEMQTKGLCGSGILEVLAELYRSGVVMKSGRFNPVQKSKRFRENRDDHQPEFVIAWAEETSIGRDVVVTHQDIREIQLAKAALYAGCKLLMRRMGIEHVEKVKIAGAFGTHVDKRKALIMGLIPDCPLESITEIGNAAGDGARAALLDIKKREEAEWVVRNVEYIELTLDPDFRAEFMQAMQIPHLRDEFPHLNGLVPEEILHQK